MDSLELETEDSSLDENSSLEDSSSELSLRLDSLLDIALPLLSSSEEITAVELLEDSEEEILSSLCVVAESEELASLKEDSLSFDELALMPQEDKETENSISGVAMRLSKTFGSLFFAMAIS